MHRVLLATLGFMSGVLLYYVWTRTVSSWWDDASKTYRYSVRVRARRVRLV